MMALANRLDFSSLAEARMLWTTASWRGIFETAATKAAEGVTLVSAAVAAAAAAAAGAATVVAVGGLVEGLGAVRLGLGLGVGALESTPSVVGWGVPVVQADAPSSAAVGPEPPASSRSEERRVGKECQP